MLTDDHIERLKDAVDDDPDFIADTQGLVDWFKDVPMKTTLVPTAEADKLMKVLLGLPGELRSAILISHLKSPDFGDFTTTKDGKIVNSDGIHNPEDVDPVTTLMLALENINNPDGGVMFNDRRNTLRNKVSGVALGILRKHDIHAGTSKTGAFTTYLTIIFDALGADFDAHNAVRHALK